VRSESNTRSACVPFGDLRIPANQVQRHGIQIEDESLAHLSPSGWQLI
jgi:hypothetical protein